jgi:hypothetical protein
MIKKSKVTNVQSNGTWEGKFGLMYKFEIEMENGDIGEYSSKSKDQDKFVAGQEVEYEFIGGNFPKVKPVYQKPGFSGFKEDPNRQKKIDKWAGLGRAIDYFGIEATKKTNEQIFAKAQEWIDWVNDKPNNSNNNDLPF